MNVLIIGASSYVGAKLFYDLKDHFNITGTYSTNKLSNDFIHLDITKKNQIESVFKKISPEIIIHTANNASSKWCKANPKKAILINQTATKYIIQASNNINSKVIYISSMAAGNPTNLYGKTKLASENITKKVKAGYLILRPSLIIGYSPNTTNDRPFNRMLKNLDEGVPALYADAWSFQPTYLKHVSEVIKACIDNDIWNKTIPISVPEITTRYGIAKDVLTPFGIKVKIDKTYKSHHKDSVIKLNVLKELNLPTYSYKKVIAHIAKELKYRNKIQV